MAAQTITAEVEVLGKQGLHLRPAYQIVECTKNFQSELTFEYQSERVDGRSILSIVTLGAVQGARLKVEAEGEDAADLIAAVVDLFANGFPIAAAEKQA